MSWSSVRQWPESVKMCTEALFIISSLHIKHSPINPTFSELQYCCNQTFTVYVCNNLPFCVDNVNIADQDLDRKFRLPKTTHIGGTEEMLSLREIINRLEVSTTFKCIARKAVWLLLQCQPNAALPYREACANVSNISDTSRSIHNTIYADTPTHIQLCSFSMVVFGYLNLSTYISHHFCYHWMVWWHSDCCASSQQCSVPCVGSIANENGTPLRFKDTCFYIIIT